MRQAIGNLLEGQAQRQGNRRRRQCVQRLELTNQRQLQRFLLHITPEQVQHLAGCTRHDLVDPQILAAPAEGNDLQIGIPGRCFEHVAVVAVGVHDGGHALMAELAEETQLGVEISFHCVVIVEVVLREVQEGHRCQVDAIETVLFKAVAGGFHGTMRHALTHQFAQCFVDGYRIWCGVADIDLAARADGTKRSH